MIHDGAPVRIVIVGKTRMGRGSCIGGMVEATGQPVRPLPACSPCHPPEIPFNIGDVWSMRLQQRDELEAPHAEDCDQWDARYIERRENLTDFILTHGKLHRGPAAGLFGGTLRFRRGGTGFLVRTPPLPAWSVEFWITPQPLVLGFDRIDGRARYSLPADTSLRIPYVGFEAPVLLIPAGTLVRVSLARWWINPQAPEEGETCSLQLSGWFGLSPAQAAQPKPTARSRKLDIAPEDIPF